MGLIESLIEKGRSRRVLITRLRYLGDVILTTPVIEVLKRSYPELEIFYMAEKPYIEVLRGNPYLSGMIGIEQGSRDIFKDILKVRRMGFSIVVDLFYNPKSAWLSFFSGARVRIGGPRRWRRKLYTHSFVAEKGVRSAVLHHLSVLKLFGIDTEELLPRVYLMTEEKEWAQAFVKRIFSREKKKEFLVVHPSAKWQAKRWPEESFVELITLINRELGMKTLLISSPGDVGRSQRIWSKTQNGSVLLPVLPIRELVGIMSLSRGVVANDGGIMHLGVALGVPTVGIMGPTDPQIWFPYSDMGPYSVVYLAKKCSPCDRHYCEDRSCMDDISPQDVFRHLKEVMNYVG